MSAGRWAARCLSTFTATAATLSFALTLASSEAWAVDDGYEDIPPEEWRALAQGRTLVYTLGDQIFAYERYPQSGNQVELQLANGDCLSGTWFHTEDTYCFDWGADTPACFRHVRSGDQILIIEQQGGEDTASVQVMAGTSDAPLLCGQQMS